jgi:hypothetical protein
VRKYKSVGIQAFTATTRRRAARAEPAAANLTGRGDRYLAEIQATCTP